MQWVLKVYSSVHKQYVLAPASVSSPATSPTNLPCSSTNGRGHASNCRRSSWCRVVGLNAGVSHGAWEPFLIASASELY
ncbi:hypothetical protein KC335_g90 [Hortaea werneckii]|nr:hypothetical protein KC335_g90 [Hortaea werneckii]